MQVVYKRSGSGKMKTGAIIIVYAVFIILISITGMLITLNVSRETTIKAPLFNLSNLLTRLENWQKWDSIIFDKKDSVVIIKEPGSKQSRAVASNGATITGLTVVNPALLQIEKHNRVQIVSLGPSAEEELTNVRWVAQENIFQWIRAKLTGRDDVSDQLDALKKFAESSTGLYGFSIRSMKVIDPVICTKRIIIPTDKIWAHVPRLLADLHQFMKANHIAATKSYYYVVSSQLADKKMELGVGVPARNSSPAKDGFEYLKLPADGNLLVGTY